MPLTGFESICSRDVAQIVSRDRGNPQYHKGVNSGRASVSHYKIDGVVIKSGNRCDYLLMNETTRNAGLRKFVHLSIESINFSGKKRLMLRTGYIEEGI